MLQGQKDLLTVGRLILSELAPVVSAQQGVFYMMDGSSKLDEPFLKLLASYAYKERKNVDNRFKLGEGLGRPVRAGEGKDPARPTCPATTCRSLRVWARPGR